MKKIIFILLILIEVPAGQSQSRLLDGTDDYMFCASPSSWFSGTITQFTWEAWIYTNSEHKRNYFLSVAKAAGTAGQEFAVDYGVWAGNRNYPHFAGTAVDAGNDGTVDFALNKWYFLAVSWDGKQVRIYYNGILDSITAYTNASFGGYTEIRLGWSYAGVGYCNLTLDGIRIWNHERTKKQILSDMSRVTANNEPGLVAYWNFDVKSGIIYDRTKNHNDLITAVGTTWKNNCPYAERILE